MSAMPGETRTLKTGAFVISPPVVPLLTLAFSGILLGCTRGVTPDLNLVSPTLSLELVSGEGPLENLNEITDAALLSGGRLAAADGGSRQVVVLDSLGNELARFGRQGEGPGEFQQLSWLGECLPDTLYLWDRARGQITVMGLDGQEVNRFPLKGSPLRLARNRRGVLLAMRRPEPNGKPG